MTPPGCPKRLLWITSHPVPLLTVSLTVTFPTTPSLSTAWSVTVIEALSVWAETNPMQQARRTPAIASQCIFMVSTSPVGEGAGVPGADKELGGTRPPGVQRFLNPGVQPLT